MRTILFILLILLITTSCEKVIDVPLNEAEQQVIVEGILTDVTSESHFNLSRSGSVYDDSGFEKISGATITVVDDLSNSNTFVESPSEPGTYRDVTFLAQPNRTYSMTINNGGKVYTASSKTNSNIAFDSLDYSVQIGGFGQQSTDTNYFVFYNFSDDGLEENYYRAIPFINGEKGEFYLTDDRLINGEGIRQPFFGETMRPGDTLDAVILSMDEANYTYFFTLANNQDTGPFSPTPGNPVTNIEGGAIGYFGVFMTDSEQIIFP